MIVQALMSWQFLNLKSTYLQVKGETLSHGRINFPSVLWQKLFVLDHRQPPQTIQECCHLILTRNGVSDTCEIGDM